MKGLIFTYLMAYGGAAVSFFDPFRGFLIYVCFSIVKPESMWFWSVPQGSYSRIVAIALLAGWITKGFGSGRLGRGRGIVYLLLAFFAWSAISVPMSPNIDIALGFVESMAKIVLPFLVGITCIDSVAKLKQLSWVILISQGYVALELNQYYYSGWNRVHEEGFGFMDNNCVAISMVTCVGMAFFLGLRARKVWHKVLVLGLAALMMHVVMFSFSRGGQLSLAITAVVAFILIPKQPKHYLVFAIAVILALRLAGNEVRERFMTSFAGEEQRDASAESRVQLWGACWDSMLKRPMFGVGPDHWPLVVHEYGWQPGKEAHTLWLQIGAELGFPGLICLLGFYVLCVVQLWPLTRERAPVPDPWLHDAARMVVAALVGFMIAAQFVSLEALEVPYYVTLIGAGILKVMSLTEDQGTGLDPGIGHSTPYAPQHNFARSHNGSAALYPPEPLIS